PVESSSIFMPPLGRKKYPLPYIPWSDSNRFINFRMESATWDGLSRIILLHSDDRVEHPHKITRIIAEVNRIAFIGILYSPLKCKPYLDDHQKANQFDTCATVYARKGRDAGPRGGMAREA